MINFKPGVIKSPYDSRDWQYARVSTDPVPLPTKFILPDLPPTLNQGSRGTCGGFAAIGAKEWFDKQEKGKYQALSPLATYLMCREKDAVYLHPNEDGITMRNLVKTCLEYGSPWESDFPYRIDFLNTDKPPESLRAKAYEYRIDGYARCSTIEDIKQATYKGSPVLVGMMLSSNIYAAINGVVPFEQDKTYSFLGGHAMWVAGWDDERQLLGCRNSWGLDINSVDEQGITWFPYDYVMLVLDIGMPMLFDAFALIDFIPEPSTVLPKTLTVAEGKVLVTIDGAPASFKYAEPFIAVELGRTFMPLRDMGELFNYHVDYNEHTNTVILTSKNVAARFGSYFSQLGSELYSAFAWVSRTIRGLFKKQ